LHNIYSAREQTFRQKFRGAKLLPEKLFNEAGGQEKDFAHPTIVL